MPVEARASKVLSVRNTYHHCGVLHPDIDTKAKLAKLPASSAASMRLSAFGGRAVVEVF